MAKKKIDDRVKEVLQKQGFDWKECLWDCHGTYVMYHKWIEIAATKNNIQYELHEVEFDTKNKIAVIKCIAKLKDQVVTTYGEAAPHNCKNSYTVAMAEKRAVDRAVLKLLGLHGFIYSEDEIDRPETKPQIKKISRGTAEHHITEMKKLDDKTKKEYWRRLTHEVREKIREMTDEFAS